MARARPFGSRLTRAARWPFSLALDALDSVRKAKEGETTNDLFGFLTTEPNGEVKAIHPKAMPVILTTQAESRLADRADEGSDGLAEGRCPSGALQIASPAASKRMLR